MNELTVPITELKSKIENLVAQHQQLKTENDSLRNTIDEQKELINSLESDKQNLIKGKSEEQNKVITDSKQKINELVQEIDNCIALLK